MGNAYAVGSIPSTGPLPALTLTLRRPPSGRMYCLVDGCWTDLGKIDLQKAHGFRVFVWPDLNLSFMVVGKRMDQEFEFFFLRDAEQVQSWDDRGWRPG